MAGFSKVFPPHKTKGVCPRHLRKRYPPGQSASLMRRSGPLLSLLVEGMIFLAISLPLSPFFDAAPQPLWQPRQGIRPGQLVLSDLFLGIFLIQSGQSSVLYQRATDSAVVLPFPGSKVVLPRASEFSLLFLFFPCVTPLTEHDGMTKPGRTPAPYCGGRRSG